MSRSVTTSEPDFQGLSQGQLLAGLYTHVGAVTVVPKKITECPNMSASTVLQPTSLLSTSSTTCLYQ